MRGKGEGRGRKAGGGRGRSQYMNLLTHNHVHARTMQMTQNTHARTHARTHAKANVNTHAWHTWYRSVVDGLHGLVLGPRELVFSVFDVYTNQVGVRYHTRPDVELTHALYNLLRTVHLGSDVTYLPKTRE